MTTPKKPDLKLLSFPKIDTPAPEQTMGFRVLSLDVTATETSAVIDFLNAHAAELPPSPQNLLSLIWCATRTLVKQGVPGEVAEMMLVRALNWVDEQPKGIKPPTSRPPPKKSG